MEGVQVLNTMQIQQSSMVGEVGIVFLLIGVFLSVIAIGCGEVKMIVVFSIVALVGLVLMCNAEGMETKIRYEVTIDKSVSYIELTEKFKVIEQRGDIWVLEEKEPNKTSLLSGGGDK